jgi:hypothetical protein
MAPIFKMTALSLICMMTGIFLSVSPAALAEDSASASKPVDSLNASANQETNLVKVDSENSDGKLEGSYYLCKSGPAVRTIRIQKKGNICKTFYTKEGVDKVVSKSSKSENCVDVASKIKHNLEVSDWKCKDISKARLSENMN